MGKLQNPFLLTSGDIAVFTSEVRVYIRELDHWNSPFYQCKGAKQHLIPDKSCLILPPQGLCFETPGLQVRRINGHTHLYSDFNKSVSKHSEMLMCVNTYVHVTMCFTVIVVLA